MANGDINYAIGELRAETSANTKAIVDIKTNVKALNKIADRIDGGWKLGRFLLIFLSGGALLDIGKFIFSLVSK